MRRIREIQVQSESSLGVVTVRDANRTWTGKGHEPHFSLQLSHKEVDLTAAEVHELREALLEIVAGTRPE